MNTIGTPLHKNATDIFGNGHGRKTNTHFFVSHLRHCGEHPRIQTSRRMFEPPTMLAEWAPALRNNADKTQESNANEKLAHIAFPYKCRHQQHGVPVTLFDVDVTRRVRERRQVRNYHSPRTPYSAHEWPIIAPTNHVRGWKKSFRLLPPTRSSWTQYIPFAVIYGNASTPKNIRQFLPSQEGTVRHFYRSWFSSYENCFKRCDGLLYNRTSIGKSCIVFLGAFARFYVFGFSAEVSKESRLNRRIQFRRSIHLDSAAMVFLCKSTAGKCIQSGILSSFVRSSFAFYTK